MKITVSLNNKTIKAVSGTTLGELLISCGYDVEMAPFAVAVNREFVPGGQYDIRLLQEQDLIDVVQPISGG